MPCSDVTYRPMNSKAALQLFNIAVAHMKFAKFSTIYQLKGQQTHATHQASAAVTPEKKTDTSSGPPRQRKRLWMKPQRSLSPNERTFRCCIKAMKQKRKRKTTTIWQSLVDTIQLLPALSLTSEASASTVCCNQHQHWCPSNHSRPSCLEEREEMQIRSRNWLREPFFGHVAELSHASGSTVEEER